MEIYLVFLTTLIILLGYPIISMFTFLCWIYKQIGLWLALKDPKIKIPLEGTDAVLAGQDPYSDPTIVLMPYFSLSDKLDISTVVKILKEKVIGPKVYNKLTQRIIRKFGYHFWYNVDNFNVENHVKHLLPDCPNMPVTRAQLRDMLTNKVGQLPFDSDKSPWEISVVTNMIDERDPEVKSVVILKVNHCLMDGFSIANFLSKSASKPWKVFGAEKLQETEKNTCKLSLIYKFLMLFFLGPYHLLKMFVFSPEQHEFVKNTYKSDFKEIYNSQCTPAIPASRLKAVKNCYRVSMSSLITTLFGQAIVNCMRKAGVQGSNTIHCLLSFPLPGQQDVLTNHWALVRIPIKVDENDPVETLRNVEKEFQSLRNSVKPLVFSYANKLIALLPLWLRLNMKSITPTTFVLTKFPGTEDPNDVFGFMARQISLGGKPSRGISFISGCFSQAGNFWLDIGGPVCNLPTQIDADYLSESIMDTLAKLEFQ